MSLIITIGPPGAGKSTWADTLAPSVCRLERDRFREAIFGSRLAYYDHPFPPNHRSYIITKAMLMVMRDWPTRDFVVSDTGLHYDAVKRFIEFYRRTHDHDVRLKVFDVDPHLLAERNRTRPEPHRIPHVELEKAIKAFANPRAWWRESGYRMID